MLKEQIFVILKGAPNTDLCLKIIFLQIFNLENTVIDNILINDLKFIKQKHNFNQNLKH